MKQCTKCHVSLPLESFPHSRCARDGRGSWCRSCKAALNRLVYRSLSPEEKSKRYLANRKWLAEHPEIARLSSLKGSKKWRELHRDERRESDREAKQRWRDQHPEARAAAREFTKRWRAMRPGIGRIYDSRRRARKRGNGGSHTLAEWRAVCRLASWCCFYCGVKLSSKTAIQEHMTPLIRGGSDDISNITISCWVCNSKKGRQTAEEFLAKRKHVAGLACDKIAIG